MFVSKCLFSTTVVTEKADFRKLEGGNPARIYRFPKTRPKIVGLLFKMETSKWDTLWAVPAVGLFVLINLFKVHSISQQKKWELPSARQIPRIIIEQSLPLISCSDQQIAIHQVTHYFWMSRVMFGDLETILGTSCD